MSVLEVANKLALVGLPFGFEVLECIRLAYLLADELLLLGAELQHLRLDGGEVALLDDLTFGRHHVVIEAVLDSGTYTELNARIELLQGFGHEVARGVPEGVLRLGILPLMQADLTVS